MYTWHVVGLFSLLIVKFNITKYYSILCSQVGHDELLCPSYSHRRLTASDIAGPRSEPYQSPSMRLLTQIHVQQADGEGRQAPPSHPSHPWADHADMQNAECVEKNFFFKSMNLVTA